MRSLHLVCVLFLASGAAHAQNFVNDTTSIPQGSPFNTGDSEQVDFGDVDGDGDFDAVIANGGDSGNDQNRLWINQGGAQGGAIGVFADATATRFPAVLDTSRDMDFVDFDGDGDLDLHTANTSTIMNQPCRFWVNMGGAQGGTAGFYVDQTASRWSGLGAAGSSIFPPAVLAGGGFVDWTSDADFGDFDNDGDADLFHTSVGINMSGTVPTRIFLNDGHGVFSEFNPSGFQLTSVNIADGNPGLWCQGTQLNGTTNATGAQCDIADAVVDSDLGDLDGDFDLDIVWCSANGSRPRFFRDRLVEDGVLGFRDVSGISFSSGQPTAPGAYEQELGDIDDDADLDIYGLNWAANTTLFSDETLLNNGAGVFGLGNVLPGSAADDEEVDFLDYDGDGDLDAYVANFSGQDRLYKNGLIGGGPAWVNVTATIPLETSEGRDADACDVDGDGDTDVFVANGAFQPELFFRNITQVADTRAPRIPALEQVADRQPGPAATVVRAQIYDNAPDYITAFNVNALEYSLNGAPFVAAGMRWTGGQVFRGEIPGALVGTLDYRVRSTDGRGNTALSATGSFVAGAPVAYCTAGTTSHGCNASMSGVGVPSASLAAGFTLTVANVEGTSNGLIFYGISGRTALPWGMSSSYQCVKQPFQRTPMQNAGGVATQCDGTYVLDWNAYRASHPTALGNPFSVGQVVDAQGWFRDPPISKTTSMSNALEFFVQP